ncbi:uncharacterized protein LY79DRAFT_692112 [Colletotrichum navitas]|uniref:Uncharacterized protein n=1 Tax=Colletotrichum navitas TaxID=681940 RepID=A0AAD8V205_9PEZI|nr:uncharacterized protein LY79DRAFT_692112 [Colletotrichum navitas]KAK1580476.1 hypothetical protein LY79DRAFT_692112 [Colletotrichum navitas]
MAPVQAMNVTMKNSWRQLLRVLLSIATSQFVPINLKMTGITDKVYEAAKKIASTFNTSLAKTSLSDTFVDGSCSVQSYSFTVSPYLHADTQDDEMFVRDLDRRLCVTYYTPKFLRKRGVRMKKPYEDCVPYLSHQDVRMATQRMEKKMSPRKERDHPYNEEDDGLHCFSAYV